MFPVLLPLNCTGKNAGKRSKVAHFQRKRVGISAFKSSKKFSEKFSFMCISNESTFILAKILILVGMSSFNKHVINSIIF